jgi:uncharacterized protein YlaI
VKSSTTPSTTEAQCHGKQGFDSYRLAVGIATKAARSKDKAISAYKCPHCKKFHVGQTIIKRTQAGVDRGMRVVEKHS